MAVQTGRIGFKGTPTDAQGRRLVDRGSEPFTDFQSLGTSFQNVIIALDCKGFLVEVVSGTLTIRGVQPVSVAPLDASAVVNNGDGTVTIAATGHGFTVGDTVNFYQPYVEANGHVALTQYPATYTILAGSDADHIKITATYAAKTPTTSYYAIGYRDITVAAGGQKGWPTATKAMNPLFVGKGTATIKILAWR